MKVIKVLVLIILVASTVIFGSCQRSQSESNIRIGLAVSLSGDIPTVGQSTIDAALMAIEPINEAGGLQVGNRKYLVELVVDDAPDNAEGATASAQRLIDEDNVIAIVGPQASRNAIPAASVAETSQVPLISPWSTNPATTENKRYAFRVPYTDPLSAAVMARFAHADLEAKKAAILYDSEQSHNSTSADVFAKTFKELGGTVVATEAYTTDTLDFEAHLMRIRGQEPQVLYLPNYANEVPLQAQQARELGIEATLLGSDAWGTMSEGQLSEDLEGSFFSSHFAADNVAPEARTFVTRYQERYNRLPDDVAALTYDAFGLLFRAIQSQEEIGTEAIRNGLFSVSDYRGVTGVIAYEQSGDPTKSVVVMKIQNERFKFDQLSAPQ